MQDVLKMLNKAALLAASNKNDINFYLAAVALRKDGTLVCSVNNMVRQPTPSAHAEARVLRKAGAGSILWVSRVLKDGVTWAKAAPCKTCRTLINNKLVSKVYYTIGPNEFGVWKPGDI